MNPELQRNLWLEAPPRRLVWAAVSLLLIYGAVILLGDEDRVDALAAAGGMVFVVALVWLTRASALAVLGEIGERTWDFQRTASLDPWSMTWGKLLGAPALAWLAGLSGLALATLAAPSLGGGLLAVLVGLGLMAGLAGLGLGAALIGVRKARPEGRAATFRSVLGGVLVGAAVIAALAGSAALLGGRGAGGLIAEALNPERAEAVRWWGLAIDARLFQLLSVWAFAGFAVAGAWRLMRLELQMRNAPVVWPAFVAFVCLYAAGLAGDARDAATTTAALTAGVGAALAYAAAFAEPADVVALRRFAREARAGRFAVAAGLAPAPLWPLLAAMVGLVALAAAGEGGGLAPVSLLAVLVRDLGVIAFFRFGPKPRRGDFGAVVALAVLYGAGAAFGAGLGGGAGLALMLPSAEHAVVSTLSALAQAAVAWMLATRRIAGPPRR